MTQEAALFQGPAGALEGYIHLPEEGRPCPGVAVCHPHPLMGGDMSNNVVTAICYDLARLGMASIRFNFRGVGMSLGAYDEGRGEVEDALAALRFLASHEQVEQGSVGLAGYSFGAGVAMKAALQDDLPRALSVVARARVDPEDDLRARSSLPMQFVVGAQDRLMPPDQANRLKTELAVNPEMHVILGADHFFHGREREVGALVAGFFGPALSPMDRHETAGHCIQGSQADTGGSGYPSGRCVGAFSGGCPLPSPSSVWGEYGLPSGAGALRGPGRGRSCHSAVQLPRGGIQ